VVIALIGVGNTLALSVVERRLGDLGEIVLGVPWLQVGAIVVVATVAGLLASVLPARRAAQTPPSPRSRPDGHPWRKLVLRVHRIRRAPASARVICQ
jgi:hypothetical protein